MKPTPAPESPTRSEEAASPAAPASTESPAVPTEERRAKRRVYQPPAILWEQPFVALAQTSACPIPGESECVP
jgi:hypothetical protein